MPVQHLTIGEKITDRHVLDFRAPHARTEQEARYSVEDYDGGSV